MASPKTKCGVVQDITTMDITTSDGVDVKDTQMLTGMGELPAGYDAANVIKPYETGAQTKGGSSKTGSV